MNVLTRPRAAPYYRRLLNLFGSSIVAYWPLWEASGGSAADISGHAYNGSYSGLTLGQVGIGDGRTCPLWDAVNDQVNVYSAGFVGAFNGAEGSILLWSKVVNAGVWTDGANHNLYTFKVDDQNYIYAYKSVTDNQLNTEYRSGNASKSVNVGTLSSTYWIRWAAIWSKSSDYFKLYMNGSQVSPTRTGLGDWAGTLGSTTCNIGGLAGSNGWAGYLAHCVVLNRPATADEILKASRV